MFAAPAGNVYGNNLPPFTGAPDRPFQPGPAGGNKGQGGQLGGTGDNNYGADPRAPKMQPYPRVVRLNWMQEAQHRSYGINGFNDQLTVKDRHAYWDTGNQKTGIEGFPPAGSPQTYNDPKNQPPRPDLRLVNRTVSYQKGTDTTRNQDDLSRPYNPAPGTRGFIGEQGSGWGTIYGGVPGLYVPYGTRGGIPYPIQSPVQQGQPGDGPHLVFAGPPHGLHSQTPWKGGEQIIARFMSTPQTRPVRQDRPSNSPQAGQSYSQTVRPQGTSPVRPAGQVPGFLGAAPVAGQKFTGGRGFTGQFRRGPQGGSYRPLRGGA